MNKEEALEFVNGLPQDAIVEITVISNPPYVTSRQIEEMGISRQLLRYYVKEGYVRTIPHGKQKRYLMEDVMKYAKEKR